MPNPHEVLSDIIFYSKYATYRPDLKRRETFKETVDRNKEMHQRKFPYLHGVIEKTYQEFVHTKKVMPAMRSLQFGGRAIETKNVRMYNCLAENTRFITKQGTKSFQDFEDGDTVQVLAPSGKWQNATVKSYGSQELDKITFGKGASTKIVFATSNHKWLLKDGTETTELGVRNILRGAPITANFVYEDAEPLERLYWAYGYVYGDGTRVQDKNGQPKYSMVRLCGADSKYEERFTELGFKSSKPLSAKGDVFVYTGTYLKTAPDPSQDSPELIRAFVEGFLAADGYKQTSATSPSRYKSIQSSYPGHQKFIEDCFEVAGYYILSQHDLTGQVTNFGIRPQTYSYGLNSHIGTGPNNGWSVKSIEPSGRTETVWCLEVEEEHAFVLSGGIVTGNCSYLPVDSVEAFSETMFLLLAGCGVGYSVQKHHVDQLPAVEWNALSSARVHVVEDTIEGWADAVKAAVNHYLAPTEGRLFFDYTQIRPEGSPLVTSGGKAPGAAPLEKAIDEIMYLLGGVPEGQKLTTLQCHDIMCHLADAVRAGGIRRSAMIALFSKDDQEMLTCKGNLPVTSYTSTPIGEKKTSVTYEHGGQTYTAVLDEWSMQQLVNTNTIGWWHPHGQRGRANNSVVLERDTTTEAEFRALWRSVETSGAGEPGFYWTNNKELGTNPCVEVSLRPFQMCNLCEINASDITSQEDLEARARAAAFIGTLQAAYTDFNYLRPVWRETVEEDALIGVGATGIASGNFTRFDLERAAEVVKEQNQITSRIIGINRAARTTVVKPSGTASIVLGTSSGIHAWHNDYYIRTVRLGKNEPLALYLKENHPQMVEDALYEPGMVVVSVPIEAPKGAVTRHETTQELLERIADVNTRWVRAGHRKGDNFNNVSATVSVKEDEWYQVGKWMWDNKEVYTGISVMPYDGGNYAQTPFSDTTHATYLATVQRLQDIDLTRIREEEDNTDLMGEAACGGVNGCEIVYG